MHSGLDDFWKATKRVRRGTIVKIISSDKKSIIALITVILTISLVFTCCGAVQSRGEDEKSDKPEKAETSEKTFEYYQFSLDNDLFVGEQNDQEMGDYQICFYGDIESFTGLTIGKGVGEEVWKEHLQVTDESITVLDVENGSISGVYKHGLELKDYISVVIVAGLNGKARIEVLTNGGSFVQNDIVWSGRNGRLFAEATGDNTVLKNCSLSYYCNGWDKDIWMYGDSYFSTTSPDRWTTYLIKNGASDILLSGHDGEGSRESLEAFNTQLQYGTPKTVVWCVGMNDGDSDAAINPDYKECLNEVIEICKNKNIDLILTTIPTCPYWLNDHKNEYINSLGFTTIDFVDAVGSHDNITWKENMLEEGEDRIHPTTEGALSMYGKAVSTVPELLKQK